MTEDTVPNQRVKRIERVLRAAAQRGRHDVIVIAEDETKAFVHLEMSPGFIAAHARTRGESGELLSLLGWRETPDAGWTQYVYPQRGRDFRALAEWTSSTLVDGFGAGPKFSLLSHERDAAGPLFTADPKLPTNDRDERLVESAEEGLSAAPFAVRRNELTLDVVSLRHRHRAELSLTIASNTICCDVLHLVEPDAATVTAHLQVNPSLGHLPFIYAERTLTGGRRALVLQSKIKAPRWATLPVAMAGTLCGLIEPLLASHRRLHTSPR